MWMSAPSATAAVLGDNKVGKKQFILFGAGDEGNKLLNFLGAEQVFCFADNDPKKVGTEILGKRVISFSELLKIHRDYRVVVAVSKRYRKKLFWQLFLHGCFQPLKLAKAYQREMGPENPRLLALKNSHRGERCFIVGNGPSLRIEDLEALSARGEFTFSCNQVFRAFESTSWRPSAYCAIDPYVAYQNLETILGMEVGQIFLSQFYKDPKLRELPPLDEAQLEQENVCVFDDFVFYQVRGGEHRPPFSRNCERYVAHGCTVIYSMIQLAVYMGFGELYLLGIDFDYSAWHGVRNLEADYFVKNYHQEGQLKNPERLVHSVISKKALLTARRAQWLCGFRIYNASRGGKLEVFPRVNLDLLLKQKSER